VLPFFMSLSPKSSKHPQFDSGQFQGSQKLLLVNGVKHFNGVGFADDRLIHDDIRTETHLRKQTFIDNRYRNVSSRPVGKLPFPDWSALGMRSDDSVRVQSPLLVK
jgi:hypothetical protein